MGTRTGTIYLLHFERPFGRERSNAERAALGLPPRRAGMRCTAQHYLGWTTDLEERLAAHRSGQGAALLRAVAAAGIAWRVARTWTGGRSLERRLKNYKKARQLCPICSPGNERKSDDGLPVFP